MGLPRCRPGGDGHTETKPCYAPLALFCHPYDVLIPINFALHLSGRRCIQAMQAVPSIRALWSSGYSRGIFFHNILVNWFESFLNLLNVYFFVLDSDKNIPQSNINNGMYAIIAQHLVRVILRNLLMFLACQSLNILTPSIAL